MRKNPNLLKNLSPRWSLSLLYDEADLDLHEDDLRDDGSPLLRSSIRWEEDVSSS